MDLNHSSQLEDIKKQLADAQRQLGEAQDLVKERTKELEMANDHIFRLQPSRNDITESEAEKAYNALCNNVQRWTENHIGSPLSKLEDGRLSASPHSTLTSRFSALMREPATIFIDAEQSDEYHVMAVIMNYLFMALFAKSFYSPLDDTESDSVVRWIDGVESSMSQNRDLSQCRHWRSETLTALACQPTFDSRRVQYIQQTTRELAVVLSWLDEFTSPGDLEGSIRKNIIEPAADLAHRLHLATNKYFFKWPSRTAGLNLEAHECINLTNGGLVLDPRKIAKGTPPFRQVSYLFDIAPGLFVERIESGKKTTMNVVCRPTILVHTGEGPVTWKPTIMRWLLGHTGGIYKTQRVASLDTKLRRPIHRSKL